MSPKSYLPPPRRFVPEKIDAGNWPDLEPHFKKLERDHFRSAAEFESWLLDLCELESILSAAYARRYIDMTCQIDDEGKKKRYLDFTQEIDPKAKIAFDRLDRVYLQSPFRRSLPERRYEVLDRVKASDAALFCEANVPLEAKEVAAASRYTQLVGSLTVNLDGVEKPIAQAALELEVQDRGRRELVWRKISERRFAERDAIEKIFGELLGLRQQQAANAKFSNYRDYRFRKLRRFDYGVKQCEEFHRAALKTAAPVMAKFDAARRRRLGIESLRPWDFDVDPHRAAPLRPFRSELELCGLARSLFGAVDPAFEEEFRVLEDRRLLDLFSRPHKAPGGYQYFLEDIRMPFIFANAAGNHDDVQTLLHEGGHAFHSLANREDPIHLYRDPPLEFCEVASMGMEFLALEHLEKVYSRKEARRAKRSFLERQLRLLAWISIVDSFQHWIYTQPADSVEARRAEWCRLRELYTPSLDWSGLRRFQEIEWHRQGHVFRVPFYYIEYGVAMLGALQLWSRARKDPRQAVDSYRAGIALGGSRPLPELFQAAGLRFEFGESVMGPLVEEAYEEWKRLSGG
ncbi:MAG: M3 family oligoendopeptidase [Planctomycetes bacterium]|nr:M3 family oligoendopeptidase [Planctomycetota bacterium]